MSPQPYQGCTTNRDCCEESSTQPDLGRASESRLLPSPLAQDSAPENAFSCQECWGAWGPPAQPASPSRCRWGGEDSAHGCIVPGVSSTYRRIPEASQGCSLDSREGDGELKDLKRQVPLLKLTSRDSGVEMAVGEGSLTTSPGLSQDSLDLEPMGSPGPLALSMELPAHLVPVPASRKLEQALERSTHLLTSPASSSQHHHSLRPARKPECEVPLFRARSQEGTEAVAVREADREEAEVVRDTRPEAWACLPGQGLRYLEHVCLVLEQMVRLQQLHLQLQTQRLPWGPIEEEVSTLAPLPSPSHAPDSVVHGSWELLSQTKETGAKRTSLPKVGVPSANPLRLSEVHAEPAHTFHSSQSHKDLSHWNKVKILLNRIRWKSPKHLEPLAAPHGPAPRIESGDLLERPPCRPLQKTFMPSLVVKKQ